jgi:folate-dependent phosphoribosylglycinamide formyltransferase PurN
MINKKIWVAMFSQSGLEIANVSKRLGRIPDVVLTNKDIEDMDTINTLLTKSCAEVLTLFSTRKPSVDSYITAIPEKAIVTMHGYLRIIPAEVCEKRTIYNLHPANLIMHPQLKGLDPQKKAFKMKLGLSGNTIHECTAELDSGKIITSSVVDIAGLKLNGIIDALHSDAENLWVQFLKDKLNEY